MLSQKCEANCRTSQQCIRSRKSNSVHSNGMGSLTSRQNAGVEEVDIVSNHAYKYPPRSGKYCPLFFSRFLFCAHVPEAGVFFALKKLAPTDTGLE